MENRRYAVLIKPLSEDDGGGWIATVPDLPGCMSDGETMAEAAENVLGAIDAWLDTAEEEGRPIPCPGAARGEWRQRVPRTLHAMLAEIAKTEGVSLNALVSTLLAESVGRRECAGMVGPPQDGHEPPERPRGKKGRVELVHPS